VAEYSAIECLCLEGWRERMAWQEEEVSAHAAKCSPARRSSQAGAPPACSATPPAPPPPPARSAYARARRHAARERYEHGWFCRAYRLS